ncbi:hypothetical protein EJ05DRAFT_95519 [Pseudovirgaria hyperparasitica]|uniref:Mitochondrial outer membrane transport complex Sam37/metaxin N-terminal domain-containing protein n=1 Tax=Pseudovirgaria hyperparasitica TaxID=470096 RepID=A0A6A6W3X4_9PEZI|nr:uncharacterized protein EJ05DRAFT_95519 [Pseudovirgaria hyperparasitica]KAF2756257.1 hypothetical protein EJ05DRAFT_95519 [Pseudovirgaria hyperparasitica]
MVLELHVWGPAFGLPSIDAECIATAAFLNCTLTDEDWTISAAHDPASSPTKSFPALKDGDQWIGGYHAIVRHIRKQPRPSSRLDEALDAQQEADTIAFSALLERHALPLIDIALYTSYENYSSTTRPAYTRILPWHSNYSIPPSRRSAARSRTAHLGLRSLDVDTTHDSLDTGHTTISTPSARFEAEKRAATASLQQTPKPAFWNRNRTTLNQALLTSKFKLDALTKSLLDPLSDVLAEKPYLLTTSLPTSLDCLALAYLSLLLFPPVPQAFVADTMKTQYPRLAAYTTRLRASLLGGDVDVAAVLALNDGVPPNTDDVRRARAWKMLQLPWVPAPTASFGAGVYSVAGQVLAQLPFAGRYLNSTEIVHADADMVPDSSRGSNSMLAENIFHVSAGVLAAVVAGTTYLAFGHAQQRTDNLIFERQNGRRRGGVASGGLGDAGDFLNTALGGGYGLRY